MLAESSNKPGPGGRSFSPKYSSDGEGNKIEKRLDSQNKESANFEVTD